MRARVRILKNSLGTTSSFLVVTAIIDIIGDASGNTIKKSDAAGIFLP